jgi:hypothetical protein
VWHVKETSLLKAVSAKQRSKFAALSPAMVTFARLLKKIARATQNETNKPQFIMEES